MRTCEHWRGPGTSTPSVHPGGKIDTEVLGRRGRYRDAGPNLRVREVVLGDGERRERYAVCHNPREAERKRRYRATVLAELEASAPQGEDEHGKPVCRLRARRRYGRYLRLTRTRGPGIDPARVKVAERLDGKFAAHTNDGPLSAEDMALGYRQLQRVEQAWRQMKSGLGLRPVHRRAERRIRDHVALTVLALLLKRTAEHVAADFCRNIHHDLGGMKLVQWLVPNGTLRLVTEPPPNAAKRLESLQIAPSPTILKPD